MTTQISPMIAVRDGREAIEFYKTVFGAVEHWRIGASTAASWLIGKFLD